MTSSNETWATFGSPLLRKVVELVLGLPGVLWAAYGFMVYVSVRWVSSTNIADMIEFAVWKGTLWARRFIPSETDLAR